MAKKKLVMIPTVDQDPIDQGPIGKDPITPDPIDPTPINPSPAPVESQVGSESSSKNYWIVGAILLVILVIAFIKHK